MTALSHVARRLADPGLWATVGLGVYLLGTAVSLATGATGVFQRFGSLGVAAAILFFTDRLLKLELERQRTVERMLHEYGVEFEVLREGIPPRELPPGGYEADYLSEEAKFSRLRRRAGRINALNIVLLTVATLQWGFGDVFLEFLHA
ncbi:hypothetical protein ACQ5SP_04135 [Rhodovulum sp. YNF3179]|uniref:hypothetical protein n=1 Tax=Rhodovulum sp. YNF3179 TaxID=3425127 RepID=UPI003D32CB2D